MVEPNGTIIVAKGITWDNSGKDVVSLASLSSVLSFVQQHAVYTGTDFTYIRSEPGTPLRLPISADSIFSANYIAYTNTGFSDRWFFGFITKVEYKSPTTCFVYFEEDIWTNWFYSSTFKTCFVEREHVNDDTVGANTVPENLEKGPYITTNFKRWTPANLQLVCFTSEQVTDYEPNKGYTERSPGFWGGMYIPCFSYEFGNIKYVSGTSITNFLSKWDSIGKSQSIIGFYIMPGNNIPPNSDIIPIDVDVPEISTSVTVRNNKLKTYPYTMLLAEGGGSSAELRYENFSTNPSFTCITSYSPDPTYILWPNNYNGLDYDLSHSISLSGWPQLPWTNNAYQNYIAQKNSKLLNGLVTTAITTVASAVIGGPVVGISAATLGMAETVGASIGESIVNTPVPAQMNGKINGIDILCLDNRMAFTISCKTLKPEYARIIDDYFTRFGYKVMRNKVPNITGRPAFNYIKTIGAVVEGDIPEYAKEKMQDLLNIGVTIWHTTDVGNYAIANDAALR